MSELDDILKSRLVGYPEAQEIAKADIKALMLELIDVEPCEPECSPERHAYHEGQWDLGKRIEKRIEDL